MSSKPRVDDGIVIGNRFDKYGSKNPVVRGLMAGFDRGLNDLLALAGPATSVLEVGCGEGHVTAKLAARYPGARVLGTDFSQAIVDEARAHHPGLEFRACSIYDAPALGTWDLVVACEVFEHVDDPVRALDAVCRAATRHVLITVPREPLWRLLNLVRGRYWGALGNTDGHVQHWSRGALLRFVASRLDVVATRAPLPWTQALGRPRRAAHA
jgi:2-polyprenyl-3-methyl-5-hydroxy-6-metoxy-1,4-benzoquinol methylase